MPSTYNSVGPIAFSGLSMVTATLGDNDASLGTRVTADGNEYVFVYNDCNSQALPGMGMVLSSGVSGMSCSISSVTSADFVIGVVKNATLTTGTYGWLCTRGHTPIKMMTASGSVAALGLVQIGGNGLFSPVSNTTGNLSPCVGQALEAIVSTAVGPAYISCY